MNGLSLSNRPLNGLPDRFGISAQRVEPPVANRERKIAISFLRGDARILRRHRASRADCKETNNRSEPDERRSSASPFHGNELRRLTQIRVAQPISRRLRLFFPPVTSRTATGQLCDTCSTYYSPWAKYSTCPVLLEILMTAVPPTALSLRVPQTSQTSLSTRAIFKGCSSAICFSP